MVRDDGDLARVAGIFRRADWTHLRDDGAGGDDFAVLRRHDRRSFFCDAAIARGAAPGRRRSAVLRVDAKRLLAFVRGGAHPHPVLHADARAHQLAVVPADARSRTRVSSRPRPWHDRVDCGRPRRRHAGRRGDRAADAARRRGIDPDGDVLSASPAYPTAVERPRTRARCPRSRCAEVDEGSIVCGIRHRVVPCLHPAAVLLRVREPVSERDRRDERGREDDHGADVRAGVHAPDAVVLPPPRREADAAGRHGRVGDAIHSLRLRQQRRAGVDAVPRHPAPRHLLRLLFRHGADLRRIRKRRRTTGPLRKASLPSSHTVWEC